jgi:hypothetical protein
MARKITYEQALVSHGWVALDPADIGVIEKLFKKDIREGEEKLALAVLESAVEDFQKHVLSNDGKEKESYSKKRKSGFYSKGTFFSLSHSGADALDSSGSSRK